MIQKNIKESYVLYPYFKCIIIIIGYYSIQKGSLQNMPEWAGTPEAADWLVCSLYHWWIRLLESGPDKERAGYHTVIEKKRIIWNTWHYLKPVLLIIVSNTTTWDQFCMLLTFLKPLNIIDLQKWLAVIPKRVFEKRHGFFTK